MSYCVVCVCLRVVVSNILLYHMVPCCDVRYDLRIEAMFGSSLPPFVCRMCHVLFMIFMFVCVYSGVHHVLTCVL
jgi:hypothetical protein